MQGSNVVEGFGLAGQAERLLALPGPFHIIPYHILLSLVSKVSQFISNM